MNLLLTLPKAFKNLLIQREYVIVFFMNFSEIFDTMKHDT